MIKQKRKNKFDFKETIFIKMQKKNEKSVIAENDVKTNFVKRTLFMISKII